MSCRQRNPWSPSERFVFSLIGLVLAVALAALIVGAIVREMGRRKLEVIRQTMRQEGTYLALDKITTEHSQEALAHGQTLLQTANELTAVERSAPLIGSGLATMRFVAPGRAVPAIAETVPAMDNSHDMPTNWADLQARLDQVRPILTSAEAILKGPVAFAYDYRSFKGSDSGAIQKFLVWWRMDALLRLRGGDAKGAIDCLDNLACTSRLIGESGTLVAATLEMGFWSYGLQGLLWEILQSDSLTDSDLVRLGQILQTPHPLEDVLRALEIELAMMPYVYDQVKADPATIEAYASAPVGVLGHKVALKIRNNLWPLLWADTDQAMNLAEWNQVIKEARTLRTQSNFSAAIGKFFSPSRAFSNADIWRFPVVTSFSSEVTFGLLKIMARLETVRQLTLTAIALKRYHLKHHAYPETLPNLVPDYLPTVPVDYFDGAPLKYQRLNNDEFLLYSVGDNGVDEGGDPTPAKGKTNLTTGKDYVWPKAYGSEKAPAENTSK